MAADQPRQWRRIPEVGSTLGLRLVAVTLAAFGRRAAAGLLWVVCWYFLVASATARRASAELFRRLGLPARWSDLHRHLWTFARVSLDRLLFLSGRLGEFELRLHGHELVMELARERRGALLVGAHLGSFEAMRCLAGHYQTPMLVLADFHNARRVNALMAHLSPGSRVRLLELDPEDPTALLEVRAAVERGELVAMLGDRPTGRPGRDVMVPFLGGRAPLPIGPWVLAHLLECPVFFVCAVFTPPHRYDVHCVPLFDRVVLPRGRRAEACAERAAVYAGHLEARLRAAPLNWFNFFPFWET